MSIDGGRQQRQSTSDGRLGRVSDDDAVRPAFAGPQRKVDTPGVARGLVRAAKGGFKDANTPAQPVAAAAQITYSRRTRFLPVST